MNKSVIWILVLFCLINFTFAFSNVDVVVHFTNDDADTSGVLSIDKHGAMYNGTLTNGVTAGMAGKINEAYDYDDAGTEYTIVADNAVFDCNTCSINMWVNSSTETDDYTGLWNQRGGNSNRNELRWMGLADTIHWATYDGASSRTLDCDFTTYSFEDGQFHMITVTKLGTNESMYLDGDFCDSINNAAATIGPDVPIWLGRDNAGTYWNGIMDEVTFFSSALSLTNITDLWNLGDGLAYPFLPVGINFSITNSTYNMTSDGGCTNWTQIPLGETMCLTTDGTPTATVDTNYAASCSMRSVSQTVYNSSFICGTTGATSHVCTIFDSDKLDFGTTDLTIACSGVDSDGSPRNVTSPNLNINMTAGGGGEGLISCIKVIGNGCAASIENSCAVITS